MVQDPSGLLERIPELGPLCENSGVRKAVERGNPFAVYRALLWAKWTGKLSAHRETLRTLLGKRRLFARPTRGRLFLGTLNSFGASLVGDAEPDSRDGTYIATHAIVILFQLALFPLGAYVVRPVPGKRRSWHILARVPLGALSFLYSRAVALALLLAVAGAGFTAFHASRNQEVRILNAFDVPLKVKIGALATTVAPRGSAVLDVPVGRQPASAVTTKGEPVEQLTFEVNPGLDLLAWNIAGATPLMLSKVRYSSSADASDRHQIPPQVFCGQQVVAQRNVDDLFTAPPSTVSMPQGTDELYRSHVLIAPTPKLDQACVHWLSSGQKASEALRIAELSARLGGWPREETETAFSIAMRVGPDALLRIAKPARRAHAGEDFFERLYQHAMIEAGHRDEIEREYAAAAAAAPDSPHAQFLYAHLLDGQAGIEATEKLAARFPDDDEILKSITYLRYAQGRWDEAAKGWSQLDKRNPQLGSEDVDTGVISLFASGDKKAALAAARSAFRQASAENRWQAALLYAQVARATGEADPEALIREYEAAGSKKGHAPSEEDKNWPLRAWAGLPLKGAPADLALLERTLATNPAQALATVSRVPVDTVSMALDPTRWALLYGEATRVGDAKARQLLGGFSFLGPTTLPDLERYVRGEQVSLDLRRVSPEIRAAAEIVRARNDSIPARQRDALRTEAVHIAPLDPLIARAAHSWSL